MPAATRTYAELVANPETFATVLLVICSERFPVAPPEDSEETSFLHWDPEVIRMEVDEEFQTRIGNAGFNKLMAAVRLVTSNAFYKSLDDFIDICNALFSGTIGFYQFDPADAAEIAWGITESLIIEPPDRREEEPFVPEIVGYIEHAIRNEGIMVPPDVLRLGQLGGADLWHQVQGNFSDDPRMFAAIYEVEKEKTEEINQLIKDRLRALLQQLDSLPLEHGRAENMVQQLLQGLQQTKSESEELRPISTP